MHNGNDIARARDALYAIPPNVNRAEWVRAGMAAHAAGLEMQDFDQWSSSAPSYNAQACRSTWRSFKAGKGVGAGTLFAMASEHGWSESSQHMPSPTPARPVTPPKRQRAGMSAAQIWERCEAATNSQPYIRQKKAAGVPLNGLRIVPDADPLTIQGERMAGALVVPVLQPDGTLSSLQFIAPPDTAERLKAKGKPGKLNLPGHSVEGWFTVGVLSPGAVVYIVEGVGQAWACWQATGAAAVVCFGAGNMAKVAQALRAQDASARLVVVPDVGKEADALTIAKDVQGLVAAMPAGWPQNSDVNDLAQRDGTDVLEAMLQSASEPPKPPPRYKLLSGADLEDLPPLTWRVRGILPAEGLAAIYGPSGCGKSFLAFDLAAAIADERRWFDCRVEAVPVVYVALEGEAGFKLRAKAWAMHRGQSLPAGLHLILQPFKLTDPRDVKDLASVVPAGAVVFLDTLNRAAPTADENSSKDMGEILEAAKHLQSKTRGLVVVLHHTGKNTGNGMRGHSSLFAALDAAIEVSREGDARKWEVAKSKDGQDGASHPFTLQTETLGTDEYGDVITSCVVLPGAIVETVSSRRDKLPRASKVALDALRTALDESGTSTPETVKSRFGALAPLKVSPEEAWRQASYRAGIAEADAEKDSQRRAFNRARSQLLDLELAGTFDGFVWLK